MKESMEFSDIVTVEGVWLWAVDCRWNSEILVYETSQKDLGFATTDTPDIVE